MGYAAACLVGYLLGSVPAALLVARRHGVDLRAVGDGNPGAWNALDHLGARRAWAAFAGGGAEGGLPAVAGLALGGTGAGYAAVAAAMLGHAFPAFAGLRGGKAVMCFVGGMLVLAPAAGLIAVGAGALTALATRSLAYGARVVVFGLPAAQLLAGPAGRVAATGALMGLIGALFALRGRSARATSGPGAAPTT